MSSVAVLVSTYNGEKFLREQLDSILCQKDVEVEIFVRDDGSSDMTKDILTEYETKYGNFHVEFAQNVGVGNSFMNLLYSTPETFDYYAFSDQDDIWLDNKLIEAVELLEKSGKLLYASNQECVDKDGNSLGLRYGDNDVMHLTPVAVMSANTLAGCTMIFNNRFFRILSDKDKRPTAELLRNRIHDVWVTSVAALYNGVVYDERSFIKYRQHGANVVGAYRESLGKRTKKRVKKLFNNELRNGRSKLARELCEKFVNESAEFPLLKICASGKKRQILKNQKELRSFTGEGYWGFKAKVIFGLF